MFNPYHLLSTNTFLFPRSLQWLETHDNWYRGFFQHVGTSVALALIAFMPVAIAPVSGGSGIAEAKAVLKGLLYRVALISQPHYVRQFL